MQERAFADPKIDFAWNSAVEEIHGDDKLTGLTLSDTRTGETRHLDATGLFIAIGHDPRSELLGGQVDLDENGYVITEGKSTRTNLPGFFAAGDLVDHTYRQAVTAAGTGCMAALDAEWYLRDNPKVPTPAALEGTGDLAEEQWVPSAQPTRSA
jgi:thioredoxin reductase (NADPH)